MEQLTKRETIALQILNGAVSADWKFDIPSNMSWGQVAALKAFELADHFLDVCGGKVVMQKAEPVTAVTAETEPVANVDSEKVVTLPKKKNERKKPVKSA